MYIDLHVQPNARHPGVQGLHDDRLKLAVAAPAHEGRANEAVIATLADLLNVPKKAVTVVAGNSTRRKRVHIDGVSPADAHRVISEAQKRQ